MKKNRLRVLSLALLFILIVAFLFLRSVQFSNQRAENSPLRGEVIAVLDGDTVKVRMEGGEVKTVRLLGIDTPELSDPRDDVKWLASVAKRYTFWQLYGEIVELHSDWDQEDQHGRMLAYIWTEKGMFNTKILQDGFASAFLRFPFKHSEEFKKAEETARMLSKGFWNKAPYPTVSAGEAIQHLGRLSDVRFLCTEIKIKGRYCFFHASEGKFSALLLKKDLTRFPGVLSFEGKRISVIGLLEDYKGRPQVMIFHPWQIKAVS